MNEIGLVIITIALAYCMFWLGGSIILWLQARKEGRLP